MCHSIRFIAALIMLTSSSFAIAIDFKIDLPPSSGKASSNKTISNVTFEDSTANNNAASIDDELSRVDVGKKNNVPKNDDSRDANIDDSISDSSNITLDLPEISTSKQKPTQANKAQNKAKELATTATAAPMDLSFPTPQCLKPNIAFWERVYKDADVNDALLHDKDNLSRVYALVRLPANARAQKELLSQHKSYYRQKLLELADLLQTPQNWEPVHSALAKMYSPKELTRNNVVRSAENIRVQTGLKSRFEAGVQRSLKLIPMIFDILQQDKLPPDIAYLPHVESSYHLGARSKVGAVGLWQIMPGTMRVVMGARHVQNRTNPAIATQAAARILKENYQTTGSWPLALTAYNHGLFGVMRAVKKTNSNNLCEIIERYESPSFRFASSNFYAQFLAARNVAMQRYIQISKSSGNKNALQPLLAASARAKGKIQ